MPPLRRDRLDTCRSANGLLCASLGTKACGYTPPRRSTTVAAACVRSVSALGSLFAILRLQKNAARRTERNSGKACARGHPPKIVLDSKCPHCSRDRLSTSKSKCPHCVGTATEDLRGRQLIFCFSVSVSVFELLQAVGNTEAVRLAHRLEEPFACKARPQMRVYPLDERCGDLFDGIHI